MRGIPKSPECRSCRYIPVVLDFCDLVILPFYAVMKSVIADRNLQYKDRISAMTDEKGGDKWHIYMIY